jgi:hypothetical protein
MQAERDVPGQIDYGVALDHVISTVLNGVTPHVVMALPPLRNGVTPLCNGVTPLKRDNPRIKQP